MPQINEGPKPPEEAAAPKAYRLPESRFRMAEYVRSVWNIVPEAGTPYEALLAPGYWLHNAAKLKPSDIIEVYPDDGSYYARLIVVGAGNRGALVQQLEHVALPAVSLSTLSSRFSVEWLGPFHQFCVVDRDVKEPRKTGFDTAARASKWLAENLLDLAPTIKAA